MGGVSVFREQFILRDLGHLWAHASEEHKDQNTSQYSRAQEAQPEFMGIVVFYTFLNFLLVTQSLFLLNTQQLIQAPTFHTFNVRL